MFLLGKFLRFSTSKLETYKELREISKRALLYVPKKLIKLTDNQALNDRVVTAFFTSESHQISIFQSHNRLTEHPLSHSSPSHSFYRVVLPFDRSAELSQRFVRFYSSNVRFGRIIEVMDYIAANVAYRYCEPVGEASAPKDYHFVTAAVDQIDFFRSIDATKECSFSGYVTYVGSSSIQVCIDVEQQDCLNCSATFVMVGRNKNSSQGGKKFEVPKIRFEVDDKYMRIRHSLGEERQKRRKELSKKSLLSSPPSGEESKMIHDLFIQHLNQQFLEGEKSIQSTHVQKTILMHRQDMNLHGKIFGGFIMREAVELGWLCAYLFVKGQVYPQVYNIDDIQFYSPVDVGDVMSYEALVCYTLNNIIHVVVKCKTIRPDGTERRTNEIKLTMLGPEESKNKVIPVTYEEAMLYLSGKRAVEDQMSAT